MKKVFALALLLTVFQFAKAQKLEMEAEPKAEKGVPVLAFAEEAMILVILLREIR